MLKGKVFLLVGLFALGTSAAFGAAAPKGGDEKGAGFVVVGVGACGPDCVLNNPVVALRAMLLMSAMASAHRNEVDLTAEQRRQLKLFKAADQGDLGELTRLEKAAAQDKAAAIDYNVKCSEEVARYLPADLRAVVVGMTPLHVAVMRERSNFIETYAMRLRNKGLNCVVDARGKFPMFYARNNASQSIISGILADNNLTTAEQ
jgi:hypothetical protein